MSLERKLCILDPHKMCLLRLQFDTKMDSLCVTFSQISTHKYKVCLLSAPGKGVDLILDCVFGSMFDDDLAVIKMDGRWVADGVQMGADLGQICGRWGWMGGRWGAVVFA